MNCKPGDIAVVIKDGKFLGRMFEVLCAAPTDGDFLLPDERIHLPCPAGYWVLKSLGTPVEAEMSVGTRKTMYGCGSDHWLRPIRGAEECDSVKQAETIGA